MCIVAVMGPLTFVQGMKLAIPAYLWHTYVCNVGRI